MERLVKKAYNKVTGRISHGLSEASVHSPTASHCAKEDSVEVVDTSLRQPVKVSGWLQKKRKGGSWLYYRNRWFELRGTKLYYARQRPTGTGARGDLIASGADVSVIPLDNMRLLRHPSDELCFILQASGSSGSDTYFLRVSEQARFQDWWDNLAQLCQTGEAGSHRVPSATSTADTSFSVVYHASDDEDDANTEAAHCVDGDPTPQHLDHAAITDSPFLAEHVDVASLLQSQSFRVHNSPGSKYGAAAMQLRSAQRWRKLDVEDKLPTLTEFTEARDTSVGLSLRDNNRLGDTLPDKVLKSSVKGLVRSGIPHDLRRRMWLEFAGGGSVNPYSMRKALAKTFSWMPWESSEALSFVKEHPYCIYPQFLESFVPMKELIPSFGGSWIVASEACAFTPQGMKVMTYLLCALAQTSDDSVCFSPQVPSLLACALMYMHPAEAFSYVRAVLARGILPTSRRERLEMIYTFKCAVAELLPEVSSRLAELHVDLQRLTERWFDLLFIGVIPLTFVLRTIDCLLVEGRKIIFRVGLATLAAFEGVILSPETKTQQQVYEIFRGSGLRQLKLNALARAEAAAQHADQCAQGVACPDLAPPTPSHDVDRRLVSSFSVNRVPRDSSFGATSGTGSNVNWGASVTFSPISSRGSHSPRGVYHGEVPGVGDAGWAIATAPDRFFNAAFMFPLARKHLQRWKESVEAQVTSVLESIIGGLPPQGLYRRIRLTEPSEIIKDYHDWERIWKWIPPCKDYHLERVYNTVTHGFSLTNLYRTCSSFSLADYGRNIAVRMILLVRFKYYPMDAGSSLDKVSSDIIRDRSQEEEEEDAALTGIMGAYSPELIRQVTPPRFWGNRDAFVFTVAPFYSCHRCPEWPRDSPPPEGFDHYLFSTPTGLYWGGSTTESSALSLSENLQTGSSSPSPAYMNPVLGAAKFTITAVEVFALVPD